MSGVESDKWSTNIGGPLLGGAIRRSYSWPGPGGQRMKARFNCHLDSIEANRVTLSLSVHVGPIHLQSKTAMVMGLFTDELKGGLVEVEAIPIAEQYRDDGLNVVMHVHEDDIPKCLDALRAGTSFHFLLGPSPPPPAAPNITPENKFTIALPLPNDATFKSLYEQGLEQVEKSHRATRARHLQEGWYRRRVGVVL